MPTYREALSANPAAFVDYAAQMTAAGADLTEHRLAYGEEVASLNMHWQDKANTAFNAEVDTVGAHLDGLTAQTAGTAGQLGAAGAAMETAVTLLKAADAAIHAAGFDIQPAPQVVLSGAQRLAIAMAGPFGFQLQAALEATALAATTGLQAALAGLNATDAETATALGTAAGALRPLDSKTSPTGEDLRHLAAQDHSEAGGPGGETTPEREQDTEETEEEDTEEQAEEEPSAERPQDRQSPTQPQAPQRPTMPQPPAGLGDLRQPELDDPWAGTELPDPEERSGGLASGAGGGFGGGLGSGPAGGLASSGAATAPAATGLGAASGAASAATVGGTGRTGAGSSMMGAGGGRGAGKADDEATRESTLTEDPEDDVWGIGGGDDDPYA